MGYVELLRALAEEVGCQVRDLEGGAGDEAQRLLDDTRRQLAAEREEILARERRRLHEEAERACSRSRLAEERALLVQMRRIMDDLRREAEARLPTLGDPALLPRLVDELIPELGQTALEFRVETGDEEPLKRHLTRGHPELLPRMTIAVSAGLGGGVAVSLGGRQVLDNTLPSRLRRAWPLLEGEIAGLLFGGGDGGV